MNGGGNDLITGNEGHEMVFDEDGNDELHDGNSYELLVLRLKGDDATDVNVQSKAVGLDNFISGNQYGAYHGQHYNSGLGLSVNN